MRIKMSSNSSSRISEKELLDEKIETATYQTNEEVGHAMLPSRRFVPKINFSNKSLGEIFQSYHRSDFRLWVMCSQEHHYIEPGAQSSRHKKADELGHETLANGEARVLEKA
jgi:hypothetical protein